MFVRQRPSHISVHGKRLSHPDLLSFTDATEQTTPMPASMNCLGVERPQETLAHLCSVLESVPQPSSLTCNIFNSTVGLSARGSLVLWFLGRGWGEGCGIRRPRERARASDRMNLLTQFLLSFTSNFFLSLKSIKSWTVQSKKWHFFSVPSLNWVWRVLFFIWKTF